VIQKTIDSFTQQKNSFKVSLAVFSLMLSKSIFISPFSLVRGILGIAIGLLLWIVIFILCIFALHFLRKVSWKYKKTNVKKTRILLYMIPSIALSALLLLIYFPGIMSWDSMYIWQCVVQNEYSNLHPITYVLFVDFLNNIVNSPWLVIAVQFTYSAFVFAYAGYLFESLGLNRKICWIIVIVLSFYPVNVISNVTMLKDVPYIISLVFLSLLFIRVFTQNKLSAALAVSIAAVSLIAVFSRHNGLLSVPLALALLFIYYLKRKKRKSAIKTAAIIIVVVVCFFATNKTIAFVLGNNYWQRSSTSDVLMLPSAQLSYTIDKNWDDLTEKEKETAGKYLDLGYISFQKEVFPNWHFNNRYLETLNLEGILKDERSFAKFYLSTLKEYPMDMIKEYVQLTGIVWAIPNYGYTLVRNVGIPEYYIDIGLKSQYMFPKAAAFLDGLPQIYFLLRPALWLMLSLLLLFASDKKNRLIKLIIISPMLANAAGFLVGTPAQNVRYLYCNFSCFVILLVFSFMKEKVKEITKAEDLTEDSALEK